MVGERKLPIVANGFEIPPNFTEAGFCKAKMAEGPPKHPAQPKLTTKRVNLHLKNGRSASARLLPGFCPAKKRVSAKRGIFPENG